MAQQITNQFFHIKQQMGFIQQTNKIKIRNPIRYRPLTRKTRSAVSLTRQPQLVTLVCSEVHSAAVITIITKMATFHPTMLSKDFQFFVFDYFTFYFYF